MPTRQGSKNAILGIWGYSSDTPDVLHHDSGAALILDGKVTAAVNEERMTRRKNEGVWPQKSIDEVLALSGVTLSDIDVIAMAGLPPISRSLLMAGGLLKTMVDSRRFLGNRWLYTLLTAKKMKRYGPVGADAEIVFPGHHLCHAATAYYTAPFDDCAVVTLDGIGDSTHCGSVYHGKNGKLTKIRSFSGYASPGILYSFVTKAFGFRPARHEGKLTGLAAYGDSNILIDQFRTKLTYRNRQLVSDFIPNLFRSRVDALWETTWIDELMETHSREDISAALQRHTEDICVAIVRDAFEDTGASHVALAGGVFGNVRINQKVREITPGQVWIHPGMGDGGLGLGAALTVLKKQIEMPHVYFGGDIGAIKNEKPSVQGIDAESWTPESLAAGVAKACSLGYIVGMAHGRMEYGPRALGHRSILVTADDPEINNSLNEKLKRTEFMPFAPIMTEKAAGKYMKNWTSEHKAAAFMTMTYDVTDACREDGPAIVHVDGTARPQVVGPECGIVYEILVEYGKLTGKELLINTSFNMHEEPIVHSADDAVRSYNSGAVEVLVIDNTLYASPDILEKIKI